MSQPSATTIAWRGGRYVALDRPIYSNLLTIEMITKEAVRFWKNSNKFLIEKVPPYNGIWPNSKVIHEGLAEIFRKNMPMPRLTAEEICDAALREFKTLPLKGNRKGNRFRQACVIAPFRFDELSLSLEEFTEKRVRPAMLELAGYVPSDVIFESPPALPENVLMAAVSKYMRFIADSSLLHEGMMRFDVVFELA